MYSIDKESKKVKDPDGNVLSADELLKHLNQMYAALDGCAFIWRRLRDVAFAFEDNLRFLDSIFLGAGAGIADDSDTAQVEQPEGTEPDTEQEA